MSSLMSAGAASTSSSRASTPLASTVDCSGSPAPAVRLTRSKSWAQKDSLATPRAMPPVAHPAPQPGGEEDGAQHRPQGGASAGHQATIGYGGGGSGARVLVPAGPGHEHRAGGDGDAPDELGARSVSSRKTASDDRCRAPRPSAARPCGSARAGGGPRTSARRRPRWPARRRSAGQWPSGTAARPSDHGPARPSTRRHPSTPTRRSPPAGAAHEPVAGEEVER